MSACSTVVEMFPKYLCMVLLCTFCVVTSVQGTSKLNVPEVLLPVFTDISVNFTLSVSNGGCYEWSLSRSDIISIEPLFEPNIFSCSRKAVVTVLTKEFTRKMVKIRVEDPSQDITFNTNVIVDKIQYLKIVSKTRQLFLEEPPKVFEVRAYDNQGNEFTTLEGVEFQWTIHNMYSESLGPVMRVMAFSEATYITPPTMIELDKRGKNGHIVLLESTRTGVTKIEVQLPQPEYNAVSPTEIQVIVVENIEIEPSTAYMMIGDVFMFRLFQVRNGNRTEININNDKYKLVSRDTSVADILMNRKVISKAHGKVEIVVKDIHITDKPRISSLQLPTALVFVAEPYSMTLTIPPLNSWSLVSGQHAAIIPEVYSDNNHKFVIGENVVISTGLPENIFMIEEMTPNGTAYGRGYDTGSGVVKATLVKPVLPFSQPISAENTLHVYPPLSIVPDLLILPWSPGHTSMLTNHSLKAHGGDKQYVWETDDPSIVQVTQNGSLKFRGPGSVNISVFMRKNKCCKAIATIHLLPPDEVAILDVAHEAEVFDNVYLHILLYGRLQKEDNTSEKVLFSFCDYLDFKISPENPFTVANDKKMVKPIRGACAVRTLRSFKDGCGKVLIALDTDSKYLNTSTLFCAFTPLVSFQPNNRDYIVLAVGSTYDVAFLGGPKPVFGPVNGRIVPSGDMFGYDVIAYRPQMFVYRITCYKLGSGYFSFTLSTAPIGYIPITRTLNISVFCQQPKSIEVVGNFKKGCIELIPQRVVAYTSSLVKFNLNIFDNKGRLFNNASSSDILWSFMNASIASFSIDDQIFLEEKQLYLDFISPGSHFIRVLTHNKSGDVYGHGHLYPEKKNILVSTFLLSVVLETVVEPNVLTLFNHPIHVGYLTIKGGSGYFNFNLIPPIASVKYTYKSRKVEILPQKEGSSELIIHDKCLPDVYQLLKIDIQVISVASLECVGPSKIQLGTNKKITVRLFDKDNKPLPFPSMSLSKLGLKFEVSDQSIAEFDTSKSSLDHSKGVIEVTLKGREVGHLSVWAQLGEIASNSLNIQVFPRMKVVPSNLTLVVGSEYQVTVSGGPSMDSNIHFLTNDPSITTVSSEAIVKGLKIGHTTVTVMSVGFQGEVYCKYAIEVFVISLTGVNIVAPIYKLGVGNTMPAWAIGIPHSISPMLLGSVFPPLQFKWQSSVPNVVRIQDTLFRTNIQIASDNKLSVRLYGLNPGRTNIELHVSSRSSDKLQVAFNASISIVVFNLLEWTVPNLNFKYMLIAPESELALKTNTQGNEAHFYNTFDSPSDPIISISPDGILKSGSNYGSAMVEVKTTVFPNIPQTMFLTVQVQPVHYLMINIATVLETSEDVKFLPRGLYLNLTISYHDEYGTEFYVAPHTKPSHECNICSKIHVEYLGSNHSLITSLASSGSVIFRAYDHFRHVEMEDFLKIPVENYILPSKAFLTVGEVVCFWTPILSQHAVWSTDNNILNINKNGIAVAERTGFTSVTYSLSQPEPMILSSVSLEILPLQSFLIGPVAFKIITNIVDSKYTIPVFLINEKSKKEPSYSKNCNNTGILFENFPFKCDLHYTTAGKYYPIEKIFSVHEAFDFDAGSFVCVIIPIKGPGSETSIIDSNLTLTVSNQKSVSVYDSLFFNFHPQFSLSMDELYISKDLPSAALTVFGSSSVLSNLFVELTNHKALSYSVKPPTTDSLKIVLELDKELAYTLADKKEVFLTISSPLTQQEVKIEIHVSMRDERTFPSMFDIFKVIIVPAVCCQSFFPCVILYGTVTVLLLSLYLEYKMRAANKLMYGTGKQSINRMLLQEKSSPEPSHPRSRDRPIMASAAFVRNTADTLRNFQAARYEAKNLTLPSSYAIERPPQLRSILQSKRNETSISSGRSSENTSDICRKFFADSTEEKIKEVISDWLNQAKFRIIRRANRQNSSANETI